jgi:hypothetical protein
VTRTRWILALWLLALPALVAVLYITAALSQTEHERFYGTGGAIFIGGLLALPWIVGLVLLGWLVFRRR